MTNKFKTLLKTSAALATLLASSQTWGAVTVYRTGVEEETVRRDNVVIAGAGGLGTYTDPSSTSIKTLHIDFVQSGVNGVSSTTATAGTTMGSNIKEVFITGDATNLSTVFGDAAHALPTPSASDVVIRFALKTSPTAVVDWFCSSIPANATVIVEPGSADPKFKAAFFTNTFKQLTLGINIDAPASATPIKAILARHAKVAAADAATKARLTLVDPTTFSAAVKGVSLSGTVAVTFSDTAEVVDPTGVTGYTVAAGKALTVKGTALAYASVPAVTLGAKSSVAVTNVK